MIDTPPLCDRCLKPRMRLLRDIYKCLNCSRAYDAFDGYYDIVDGRPRLKQGISQFRCPRHKHTMCLADFQFNGTESVRTWKCAVAGCPEEKVTTGENYIVNDMRERITARESWKTETPR
jgi:hypothetical protein